MSDIVIDEQEEKPLDPVMENVRRKMVRLQLISGGIMLVMFMAVLAAIVYKLTADEGNTQTAASAPLAVPSDGPQLVVDSGTGRAEAIRRNSSVGS